MIILLFFSLGVNYFNAHAYSITMEKVYISEKQTIKSPSSPSENVVKADVNRSSIIENGKNHRLELDGHQLLSVWGIQAVPAFGDKEVKILLDGETLTITGQNLEIKLLDLEKGQLIVKGYVTGMRYSSSGGEKGVLKKIFK